MSEDFGTWASIIRSCVITSQVPMAFSELNRNVRMLEDQDIPYQDLGFQTLEAMINEIPQVQILSYQGRKCVKVIPTDATVHIARMVAVQRPPKRKKATGVNQQRRKKRKPSRKSSYTVSTTRPQTVRADTSRDVDDSFRDYFWNRYWRDYYSAVYNNTGEITLKYYYSSNELSNCYNDKNVDWTKDTWINNFIGSYGCTL